MSVKKVIGIVAPARAITKDDAARVEAVAQDLYPGGAVELRFHPQCFLQHGHFAGDDDARSEAFLDIANDKSVDAVWFARGGYGSCRLNDTVFEKLSSAARDKIYLGYSDTGALLARLYAMGFESIAHGPMPADINRIDGDKAVARALTYLVEKAPAVIEPSLKAGDKAAAFNIKMLNHIVGTPFLPNLSGHILLLEDIAEYHYQLDRSFYTITSNETIRNCAGIRLGRCSDIPKNDICFGKTEEEIAQYWCDRNEITYLGRADIGHDSDNKVAPFGLLKQVD